MVILMKSDAAEEQIQAVIDAVTKVGRKSKVYPEVDKDKVRPKVEAVMVFVDGMDNAQDPDPFKKLKGVIDVLDLRVTVPSAEPS